MHFPKPFNLMKASPSTPLTLPYIPSSITLIQGALWSIARWFLHSFSMLTPKRPNASKWGAYFLGFDFYNLSIRTVETSITFPQDSFASSLTISMVISLGSYFSINGGNLKRQYLPCFGICTGRSGVNKGSHFQHCILFSNLND